MVLQLTRLKNKTPGEGDLKQEAVDFLNATTLGFPLVELRKYVALKVYPSEWIREAVKYLDAHPDLVGLTPELFVAAVREVRPEAIEIFDCAEGRAWIEGAATQMGLAWGKGKLERLGKALLGG